MIASSETPPNILYKPHQKLELWSCSSLSWGQSRIIVFVCLVTRIKAKYSKQNVVRNKNNNNKKLLTC